MADNITITPGAGATIATDEVTRNAASEHQQIIKIGLGAEGFHDCLLDSGQQTMANSLPVVVASNQSAIPVANVGYYTIVLTPTVTAGAYTAGDVIGGLLTLPSAGRTGTGSGRVSAVIVQDKDAQSKSLSAVFFNANPSSSTTTNDLALSVADADFDKVIGFGGVYQHKSLGACGISQGLDMNIPWSGATDLYMVLVADEAPTYTLTSSIKILVVFQQD